MTGKEKCKVLRQIRRDIAVANDIPVTERECTHEGPCRGTCPYCEAELKKLEGALETKRSLGQRIAIMGLSMGLLTANLTSCDLPFFSSTAGAPLAGDVPSTQQTEHSDNIPGELVAAETTTAPETTVPGALAGVPLIPEDTLMGDPVLPQPEEGTTNPPEPDETVAMGTYPFETTNLPEPEVQP